MIEFQTDQPVDLQALGELFNRSGWDESDCAAVLEWAMATSENWVACLDDGRLIGFGRSYRLDSYRSLLFDVIVDEGYSGYGIDVEIIGRLAAGVPALQEIALFRHSRAPVYSPASLSGYSCPEAPPDAYTGQAADG